MEQIKTRLVRRLKFEALEERRMLTTFVVSNLNDGPVNTPQSVGTLRQAIFDANGQADPDMIQFADNLNGAVDLSVIEDTAFGPTMLAITSPITIQGNSLGVTMRHSVAAADARLFRVTASGSLTVESLTLADGVARGSDGIAGSPNGGDGIGGAILNQGTLTISASTLTNNRASGGNAVGGGNGGAGLGGAVYNDGGNVTIKNATLSGNSVQAGTGTINGFRFGGGLYGRNGSLSIYNSTITDNSAVTGRGVYVVGIGGTTTANIYSSIIGSADVPLGFDLFAGFDGGGTVQVSGANNLIRRQNDFPSITISSDDPLLGTLGLNGGPTLTHALPEDSPAVNLGVNPLNLTTDQRSAAYARVIGGNADIGAFERQTSAGPALPGDYSGNAIVDAADYILWRHTKDTEVTPYSSADGNGDGRVDAADYGVWRGNFGRTLGPAAVASTEMGPSNAILVAVPTYEQTAARAAVPAAVVSSAREAAFLSIPATGRPSGVVSVKTAGCLPSRWRDQLELVLVDALSSVSRRPYPATSDSSARVSRPGETPAARASDELLADWPAADSYAVLF